LQYALGLIAYLAMIAGGLAALVWFFVSLFGWVNEDAAAAHPPTCPCCAPEDDDDGRPSVAMTAWWAGIYPGGRNDPNPPRPPSDHAGRIGS